MTSCDIYINTFLPFFSNGPTQAVLGRWPLGLLRRGHLDASQPPECYWGGPFKQVFMQRTFGHFAARLGPLRGV